MIKIYGVPKLPLRIDAMYENQVDPSGNYTDLDPVRYDPVYGKLEAVRGLQKFLPSGSERVAEQLMGDMRARQMDEKTYNHVKRTPVGILKLEFAFRHEKSRGLRARINAREHYMFRDDTKQWTDVQTKYRQ